MRNMLTNNNAERFHNQFKAMFVHGAVHPSVPSFMEGVHAQQQLTRNDLAKVSVGGVKEETAACKTRNARIAQLLQDYAESRDSMRLVNAIAHLYLF